MDGLQSHLLDTCVLLWWLRGNARLSREWELRLAGTRCIVSAATIWETAIKHRLGRLPVSPKDLLTAAAAAGFEFLAISPDHAVATATLPSHHQDPFDRLLIAQARSERLVLLTSDRALQNYGRSVRIL